jgi:ribosomal protein S18 acetylase RimI-like enzyme
VATSAGRLVGLALVDFRRSGEPTYAVLQDIVIESNARNCGIGATLLSWVENAVQREGIKHIFLESGLQNNKAHSFFEKHGYRTTSIIMYKQMG